MSDRDQANHTRRHPGGETYRLTLRALPSGYAPIGRLKRALKQLLRVFELRAVEVIQIHPPPAEPVDETSVVDQADDRPEVIT